MKKPRELTQDGKTGYGDPGSEYFGQVLSLEDEKRIGQDDKPIAEGKLWSEASTDVWLTVGVADRQTVAWDRPCVLAATERLPADRYMWIMSTVGKPTILAGAFAGASLELPEDLGQDAAKRQYLTEWVTDTMLESWDLMGLQINPVSSDKTREGLFNWVASATERAIRETGL